MLKNIGFIGLGLALAGCVETGPAVGPQGLRDVSPAALAALPPGIDQSFLIRDSNGCYGLAVEKTEPQRGVALLDASGKQVCDV
ncbi:hypothetical protein [Oceaniglobus trochenteri]|uniref:hypothetical protein n=1 Tax=Oceaniglobus trochenteri TaxID=2763260 RepID=UPI001CFFF7FE|nr:hypothetical protein [Oceaniglobus trochenteri]